jgi:hypothetical protein
VKGACAHARKTRVGSRIEIDQAMVGEQGVMMLAAAAAFEARYQTRRFWLESIFASLMSLSLRACIARRRCSYSEARN